MSGNDRKRQKKLERKSARRKEKKQTVARTESAGLSSRLVAATKYPILHSWMSNNNEKDGIGWVILSRELPGGMVAVACFLVDRYCLGVKNAFADVVHRSVHDEKYVRKMQRDMPGRTVPPADACKYLTEAVAYARAIGLPPHPDFATASLLLGDIDPAQSAATFEFGKDGKPFYVAGPNDSLARSRQIVAILHNHCGAGNYDYLIPFADPNLMPDDAQFKRIPHQGEDG